MRIDVHAHFVGPEFYAAIDRLPGVTAGPSRHGKVLLKDGKVVIQTNEAWQDPGHHLREMDKRGIDVSLVSLTTPNVYVFPPELQAGAARLANDEAIARARAHPDRFRVLASLSFDDVPAAVAEIERVAGIKEVCGISVGSNVNGVPLSDPRFETIWAAIDRHKMTVVEHPNFPPFADDLPDYNLSLMMGFFFDTQICVTRMILNGVFARFPNMKFVVAHTGGGLLGILNRLSRVPNGFPDAREKMQNRPFEDYVKNLYYDTCVFGADALMFAHNYLGRDRMMFGTDYPYVPIGPEHVEDLPLSAEDTALITGGNATRVFGLA